MSSRASLPAGQASPLGISVHDEGVDVAVVSENAERIFFCLFDGHGERELSRLLLPERSDDRIHRGFIPGVGRGARYGLRADGPHGANGIHRFDPAKLLIDPYAVRLDRPFAYHPALAAPRSAEVDTARFVPKAVVTGPAPVESLSARRNPGFIYEIAVKAFTRRHLGIPASLRGTVAALGHPRVIEHLTRLGIDTVELMPIAAWIDERHLPPLNLSNAWGYNPVTFLAPDPRLAPGGFAEIRSAVDALQQAGIAVLLDVVLNHTGEGDGEGTTLSLRGLDNALYYRHDEGGTGQPINDTGCGNTLAVERPPVARLVLDALRHWARQTGIDGFRFDLATALARTPEGFNPGAPVLAAIQEDPLLSGLTLIAEPWDVGPGGYRIGQFPSGWHEWNDRYRDDVRRFWRGPEGSVGAFATRIAGSSDIFAGKSRLPSRSINYVAAHDGFTLRDLVSYRSKDNRPNGEDNRDGHAEEISWNNGTEGPTADNTIEERRRRDIRALLATLLLSRGTPMLTAGDELGATQNGNNNAYAQDNETTWLDWDKGDRGLIAFVAQLSGLRRSHRVLSSDDFLAGMPVDDSGIPDALWLTPAGRAMSRQDWLQASAPVLGVSFYAAAQSGAPADRVCIWFNRGHEDCTARLPAARLGQAWRIVLDSACGPCDPPKADCGVEIRLPARAVIVAAETLGSQKRKIAGVADEAIDCLAAAAGIQPEWWEIDGTHHRVTPETKRALLKAMRLPAATAEEASETLKVLQRARDLRRLPACEVLTAGAPGVLRLAMREGDGAGPICLSIGLEQGSTRHIELRGEALREVGRAELAGETVRHLAIPLPPLPPGYHDAVLSEDPASPCRLIVGPATAFLPGPIADGARLFGLTSHLYAMRDDRDCGIGDLETLAQFGDATARLGGALTGINPLHHLFATDRTRASPYQPSDRRWIDPIYLDLEALAGLYSSPRLREYLAASASMAAELRALTQVDYPAVWRFKRAALAAAFADFEETRDSAAALHAEFEAFRAAGGADLEEHAVYEALADKIGSVERHKWPREFLAPRSAAVAAFAGANAEAVRLRAWLQWIADLQLAGAAKRARAAGLTLGIYRDLALGTALDGGEIWANPGHFASNVSLGAPPDDFARDGQVWQLAPFEPQALLQSNYNPVISVLAANMRHAGVLRIDHILGFTRQFWVPNGASGGEGAYVSFPLETLIAITAIESHRARCMVIGEDLGTVPAGLRERLAAARILSYRVLWFEKDGETFRQPETYPPLSATCISSHDLPTFIGRRHGRDIEIECELHHLAPEEVEARIALRQREELCLRAALQKSGHQAGDSDPDLMVGAHGFIARAPSTLVFVQADDLFAEREPLNMPGTDNDRPNWRRRQGGTVRSLSDRELSMRIAGVMADAGRSRS
jgi:glycogen debranching enzyme GlgX/4-alpha-glucanotransferase